jgi:hypothetical protein
MVEALALRGHLEGAQAIALSGQGQMTLAPSGNGEESCYQQVQNVSNISRGEVSCELV